MALEAAYLVPHAPILITEVGGNNSAIVSQTVKSFQIIADEMRESGIDHFYITSPHMPLTDQFIVYYGDMAGSLSRFGAGQINVRLNSSKLTCEMLNQEALSQGLVSRCGTAMQDEDIPDHGIVVPLWLLFGANKIDCTPFSLAWGDGHNNFQFGRSLMKAADRTNKRSALIVSGDLSHRLIQGAPAGYSPRGEEFDSLIHKMFDSGDLKASLKIDKQFAREAAHCGLPGIQLMAGLVDGMSIDSKVHSYEGPFGVGYMVASIKVEYGK